VPAVGPLDRSLPTGLAKKVATKIATTKATAIQTAIRPRGREFTGGATAPWGPSSTPGAESAAFVLVCRGLVTAGLLPLCPTGFSAGFSSCLSTTAHVGPADVLHRHARAAPENHASP
jgi:hypothetical protein